VAQAAWHGVNQAVSTVKHAVEGAGTVIKTIATGNYDFSKDVTLATLAWNYDAASGGAKGPVKLDDDVTCKECYFHLGAQLHFEASIQDRNLNHAAVWAEGNADLALDVEFSDAGSVKDEFIVATVHLEPVCFVVAGVTMCVDTTIPIEVGFNATLTSTLEASIRLNGYIKQGMVYTGTDSGWHRIDEKSLTPDLQSSGLRQAAAESTLTVWLMPTFNFIVDHIGGPTVGIKGILELVAGGDGTGASACDTALLARPPGEPLPNARLFVALNTGLQTALGAKLDINLAGHEIYKHEWDSLLSFTIKWPIISGCVDGSQRSAPAVGSPIKRPLLNQIPFAADATQPLSTMVTYSGKMVPTSTAGFCRGSPTIPLAYQITAPISPHTTPAQHRSLLTRALHGAGRLKNLGSLPDTNLVNAQSAHWSINVSIGAPVSLDVADYYYAVNPSAIGQKAVELASGTFYPYADTYVGYAKSSEEGYGLPNLNLKAEASADLSTIQLVPVGGGGCYGPTTIYRRRHDELAAAKTG